jgi:FkbM family methyltransferase
MSLAWYLHRPERILRKMRWTMLQARQRPTELTADTWNGRLTFNSGDRLISKFLYVRRAYEQHYLTQVIDYLDRSGLRTPERDVVLDIGANIGMIAIALVKHGWFARAIAFEPEPYNFRLLSQNVRQNGYDEAIACRQLALSSEAGDLDLVLNEGNLGGHFIPQAGSATDTSVAAPATVRIKTVRIKTVTCDEILAEEFPGLIDRIGLVWMDIEGHEGYFFQGAAQTLERGIPVVSEFYPRAIERSGMSRQEYIYQVSTLFTHVCTLSDGHFVERPIAAVEDLLSEYYEPGATNVIYLRR